MINMDTLFLISRISKDNFLENGFGVNELNGALTFNGHSAQAVWESDKDGEYLYAIAFEPNVLKAVYEVFDPTMFDDNGFKKWCCAMTDEDSEAIALDENLRVKDSVYGDVKFEDVEE